MKKIGKKHNNYSNCIICGHKNNLQAIDHQCVGLDQFKQAIEASKIHNPSIDSLRVKIQQFYLHLTNRVLRILNQDQKRMEEHLIMHQFSHIDMEKVNLSAISKIINNDYSSLPHKKFETLVRKLRQNPSEESLLPETQEFKELQSQIIKYIQNYHQGKMINFDEFKVHLPYGTVVEKIYPQLKPKKSLSDISNPEQQAETHVSSFTWKNCTVDKKSKNILLSNKNITDKQLLKEIPILSSFKNVKQFEIRHNKLTPFSCRFIASSMTHITTLDIRGNKIGDEGIIKLVQSLKNLKSLMVSDTKCTNVGALSIANNVPNLEMLWCENNQIDGPHAMMLAQKPKLKLLSFVGNKITPEYMVKIKQYFNPKGYINI